MSKQARVTITLPEETLAAVERVRRERRETRSAFFQRAAVAMLGTETEQEAEERYVRGYREHPETPTEAEGSLQLAVLSLVEDPWD